MAESPHGQYALRPKGKDNCIHHRRILELVCNTCKDLACVECVTSLHNGHHFLKLNDKIPEARREIRSFINNTENAQLPTIQQAIISAKDTLKNDTAHLDKLEKNLTKQLDRLKRDLEILSADIISSFRKLKTENKGIITGHIKELETRQEDFNRFLNECKKVLQRGSHVDIYDVRNEIPDLKPLPEKPTLGTADFTPNTQPLDHLTKCFGTVTISHSKQKDRSVGHYQITPTQQPKSTAKHRSQAKPKYKILRDTKVITEFKTPCDISFICTDKAGQVYTCHRFSNVVTLLNKKGEIQREIKYNVNISDVRLSPTTQHIWTCSNEDHSVMECVPSQSPVVRFITRLVPHCLCVTVDNCILIGIPKEIIKCDIDGNLLLTTKPSPSGQSAVSHPYKITECSVTHNVAVINVNVGDVLVMDRKLEEIFHYRGDIPIKYQQSMKIRQDCFNPDDVRYDSVGNLIIGDRESGCIHLLSGSGDYLTLIYTEDTWIESFDIDINNVLWVCTGVTEDISTEHKVKLLQYCNTDVLRPCPSP